jgi:hypothetical protein
MVSSDVTLFVTYLLRHCVVKALFTASMYCATATLSLNLQTSYIFLHDRADEEGSIVSSDGGGTLVAYSRIDRTRWSEEGCVTVDGDTST